MIYRLMSKAGHQIRLSSDDTFTLALAASRTEEHAETTAQDLADIFPLAALARLHDKIESSAPHSSECAKLRRAILIAAGEEKAEAR